MRKKNGTELIDEYAMFVYTFQAMWLHRPLEEYLVFVGIRAAHTSFSPVTLAAAPAKTKYRKIIINMKKELDLFLQQDLNTEATPFIGTWPAF